MRISRCRRARWPFCAAKPPLELPAAAKRLGASKNASVCAARKVVVSLGRTRKGSKLTSIIDSLRKGFSFFLMRFGVSSPKTKALASRQATRQAGFARLARGESQVFKEHGFTTRPANS